MIVITIYTAYLTEIFLLSIPSLVEDSISHEFIELIRVWYVDT